MPPTVGLVANIYNESNALPGWLETHLPFFDDVRILHAGPNGEYSNDGTLEILKKWNIPVEFCSIDEGFGVVRTKALRMSPCDWVMLLDADERFYPVHRMLTCTGVSTPHSEVDEILYSYDFRNLKEKQPDWNNIARLGNRLEVEIGVAYDQGQYLRDLITGDIRHINSTHNVINAIATVRRHWHDFSFRRPTQNWHIDPDWQLRLVRNDPSIQFDQSVKMHERLIGASNMVRDNMLFFDHFHFSFKRMEQEQRSHDVAIYDAIHKGEKPPTLKEFNKYDNEELDYKYEERP